jgi:hypothetical protein
VHTAKERHKRAEKEASREKAEEEMKGSKKKHQCRMTRRLTLQQVNKGHLSKGS